MAAVRLALRSIRRVSTTPTVGRALFVRYLASVPEKVTHTGQVNKTCVDECEGLVFILVFMQQV